MKAGNNVWPADRHRDGIHRQRGSSTRAGLPVPADHRDRAVSPGRRQRCGGAHRHQPDVQNAGAIHHHRECRRRRRHDRQRARRRRRARRLHFAGGGHGLACGGSGADAERQVRSAAGLRADRHHRAFAGGRDRAKGFPGQGLEGIHCGAPATGRRREGGPWRHRRILAHGVPAVHRGDRRASRRSSLIAGPVRP